MKKAFITLAAVAVAVAAVAGPARSDKRGVSENGFTYEAELHALSPGVSWFYNWGITPNRQVADVVGPGNEMEYCPMTWNGGFNEANLRQYLTEHPGVKYLLGFNEPNFRSQSNMTPQAAAAVWPAIEQLARDFNLKIVAPALNYTGEAISDGNVYQPEQWMDAFLAAYPEAHFDFLALHCYMNSHIAQLNYVENFAKKYGKQVWLTEFCAWEGTVDSTYQKTTMVRKVQDLELSPYVYRYAWFKARGQNTAPYYRLIIPPNARTGEPDPGTLTQIGRIYTYMSSFDTTFYYTTNQEIPAKDFVYSSEVVDLEDATDAANTHILQVCNFDNSGQVDYLVDIPTAGTYDLQMRMASRKFFFDPKIRVEIDGVVLVEKVIPATGTVDDVWATVALDGLAMPAGKHRLTIKSTQSTSCKLGWLKLVGGPTIPGDVNGDGVVNIDDINIVVNMLVGKISYSAYPAADVDGNGNVDIDDLNLIVNIILNKG